MPTFPFERAKGVGWAQGEIFKNSQASIIDANAAAAASGDIWSDIAIAKMWVGSSTHANHGYVLVWNNSQKRWFSFGVSGGNPIGAYMYGSGFTFTTGLTIPAGAGLTPTCAAVNPSGVMVLGGVPGSSSTSKIRESTDGNNWNARATIETGTTAVRAVIWHPGASKFVAGLGNTANTNIETSTNGQTWTQITGLPNTNARGAFATDGTTLVCVPHASVSTNTCITSTDGATWTQRTLPHTQSWGGVHWDTRYERFIAWGATNIAVSDDGITWATGGAVAFSALTIGINRVMFGTATAASAQLYAGIYDGSSMSGQHVLTAAANIRSVAYGDHQFMVSDQSGNHHWTIRAGE